MNSCAGVSLNIHSFIHNIQITFIIYKLKIIITIILKSTFNSELVITFFPQKRIDDQPCFVLFVLFSRCISYISFHAYIHLRFKHAVRTCLCLSKWVSKSLLVVSEREDSVVALHLSVFV